MSTSELGGIHAAHHGDKLPHNHTVHFYEQDSALIEELSRYLGAALSSGGAAVVVATKSHREQLAIKLTAGGIDFDHVVREGRYVALDAAATLSKFLREDGPDPVAFRRTMAPLLAAATAAGAEGVPPVVFGEMVALLWGEGRLEAAVSLELLWNGLAQTNSYALRCAYPMHGFRKEQDEGPFLRICSAHSGVIPSESYTALPTDEERARTVAALQQKGQAHDGLLRLKRELEEEIVRRIKAEQKSRDAEQSVRELSTRLLNMQEDERRHLGRELHDTVGQYLVALKMELDLLEPAVRTIGSSQQRQVADCLELVVRSIAEVRSMSHLLYPPMLEEMGLSIAIPWCLSGFTTRSGIDTKLEMQGLIGRLPREVELAVFRVLQECLVNVQRHSGGSVVRVRLSTRDGVAKIEVQDNGRGMPAAILRSGDEGIAAMGVGLRGIVERLRPLGGQLLLSSQGGATVTATVPFAHPLCSFASAET
jgi:signal transduction histidine kinase